MALSDQEWLDALAVGDRCRVHITGEGAPVDGTVVFKRSNDQIAVRLDDGRLCKFLNGTRLRGQGEFITRPPGQPSPVGPRG